MVQIVKIFIYIHKSSEYTNIFFIIYVFHLNCYLLIKINKIPIGSVKTSTVTWL